MRIMIVSPTDLSLGRGAENMLAGVLPAFATKVEVRLVSLGPGGDEFSRVAQSCGVTVDEVDYRLRGWFVRNALDIGRAVVAMARDWGADLVVLYWEIWDLVRVLQDLCRSAGIPFTVLFHAIPFAYAPARPSGFIRDGFGRIARDRDLMALAYALRRIGGVRRRLRGASVISVNETVTYYLGRYFPELPVLNASPGAAVWVPNLDANHQGPRYDCVFMAKLIPGKGIFALPGILARVVAARPKARLLVIGTFERSADERRFQRSLRRQGLADRVDLAGWVRGDRKYELLASGRVFLYPSFAADTFAIALLEALASGTPAVAYDVPFVRACYDTPAVRRVPVGDHARFAEAVLDLLDTETGAMASRDARHFASRYHSWQATADAQLAAFRQAAGIPG